eukprot:m51a1_g5625 hypothetical protein (1742) ;mRNA; r:781726-791858
MEASLPTPRSPQEPSLTRAISGPRTGIQGPLTGFTSFRSGMIQGPVYSQLLAMYVGFLFLIVAASKAWAPDIRYQNIIPYSALFFSFLELPRVLEPTLTVAGEPDPIRLSALSISVRISGFEAESTWTMTFSNPHPRVLEGTLNFPLPEGGTVTGYAIETAAGRLLDAIPVEKETARVAFEEAVRSGKEAGLAEVAAGNSFTTRVYPIPASGAKRVRVCSVAPLDGPHYVVPAFGDAALDSFCLTLETSGVPEASVADDGGAAIQKAEDTGVLSTGVIEGLVLARPIVFDLPHASPDAPDPDKPAVSLSRFPGAPDTSPTYFVVTDTVPASFFADAAQGSASAQSDRVAVVYDVSLSRAARAERAAEEKALSAALASAASHGVSKVDLVFLRNTASAPRTFDLKESGSVDDIVGAIEGEQADGGSCVECLYEALKAAQYRYALVFSDGFGNLGQAAPEGDAPCPVHTFTANAKANHALLKLVSQKSGGCFFNVASASFSADRAADALAQERPFGFIRAVGSEGVGEIYPAHPSASTQVPRAWARLKSDELLAADNDNDTKRQVLELARTYHFVAPGSSLLVLESIEDYRKHGIEPDAQALPDVHAEFVRDRWWSTKYKTQEEVIVDKARQQRQTSRSEKLGKPSISLKSWDPDTPYLTKIKARGQDVKAAYEEYLIQRESYMTSPAFYLDVSEYFARTLKSKEMALRVLTSILDIGIEEPQLYRIVGYKLDEFGELDSAVSVFRRVLQLRESEPQSFRDLGLVLIKRGRYQEALDRLWKVVTGRWDSRFDEIELTALTEINRLLWLAGTKPGAALEVPQRMEMFRSPVDADIRISMAWDTDMTDVDLHVVEPTGEECYFGHNRTEIGGMLSRDFRQGYGPEEYMCRNAFNGNYKIRAKYYASHQQNLSGGTTILLTIYTNFSRPEEHYELITIRLAQSTDIVDVGDVDFKKQPSAETQQMLQKMNEEEDANDRKEEAEVRASLERQATEERERNAKTLEECRKRLESLQNKSGGSTAPPAEQPSTKPENDKKPQDKQPAQSESKPQAQAQSAPGPDAALEVVSVVDVPVAAPGTPFPPPELIASALEAEQRRQAVRSAQKEAARHTQGSARSSFRRSWRRIRKKMAVLVSRYYFAAHIAFFTVLTMTAAGLVCAIEGGRVCYVDALFLEVSAISTTGLSPVDFSLLRIGSQVTTCVIVIVGGAVFDALLLVSLRRTLWRKPEELSHLRNSPPPHPTLAPPQVVPLDDLSSAQIATGAPPSPPLTSSSVAMDSLALPSMSCSSLSIAVPSVMSAYGPVITPAPEQLNPRPSSLDQLTPEKISQFHALQRHGQDRRALSFLLKVLLGYWFLPWFTAFIIMLIYFSVPANKKVVTNSNLSVVWKHPFALMLYAFLIVCGNTGFPMMLSTRAAGFNSLDLARFNNGTVVLYIIMMYIIVLPNAVTMRSTREDVTAVAEEDTKKRIPNSAGFQLKRLLLFDTTWVFVPFCVICLIENSNINKDPVSFSALRILFETVSAYGTVGLSLGFPGVSYSFAGRMHTLSKLVLTLVMMMGRHRGFPDQIDLALHPACKQLVRDINLRPRRTDPTVRFRDVRTSFKEGVRTSFQRFRPSLSNHSGEEDDAIDQFEDANEGADLDVSEGSSDSDAPVAFGAHQRPATGAPQQQQQEDDSSYLGDLRRAVQVIKSPAATDEMRARAVHELGVTVWLGGDYSQTQAKRLGALDLAIGFLQFESLADNIVIVRVPG